MSRDYSSHFSRKIHADQSVRLWARSLAAAVCQRKGRRRLRQHGKGCRANKCSSFIIYGISLANKNSLSRDDMSMFGDVLHSAFMHVATDDEITSGTNHVKWRANIFQTFMSSQLFGTKLENLIKTI